MEVQIRFDTENDSIEDLKKLVAGLQDIINRRENKLHTNIPAPPVNRENQSESFADKQNVEKTQGGCRVVRYEDISNVMKAFYTGKNY